MANPAKIEKMAKKPPDFVKKRPKVSENDQKSINIYLTAFVTEFFRLPTRMATSSFSFRSSLVLLSLWPLVGASTSTTSTPLFVAALAVKAEKHNVRFV